jgi:hypothetical protein
VPIGIRWAAGERLSYRLIKDVRILHSSAPRFSTASPPPREIETWVFDAVVKSATSEAATLELVLRSARHVDESPGRAPVVFDSADPDGRLPVDPLHPFRMRALLLGVPLTAVFGADGLLREVRGAERIGDDITDRMGADAAQVPGDLRGALRESLADGGDLRLALARAFALAAGTPAGPGGAWSALVEEEHLLAGRVKIRHRYTLESVDPAAGARIADHIEAYRDAAGNIPWDVSEEDEFEHALDRLTGQAEILFDVEKGLIRRLHSEVRAAWTHRPDQETRYERIEEEAEIRHTLELREVAGPTPPAPAVAARSPAPALPDFADFQRDLETRCFVSERTGSNTEHRGAEWQKAECLRAAMVRELDGVLLPMKSASPARFAALMREQAAFNRLVAESCDLRETMQWVDAPTGTRSDGAARGYAEILCIQQDSLERAYYATALRTGAAARFAAHVRSRSTAGRVAREAREAFRRDLARWTTPALPNGDPFGQPPLVPGEAPRLLDAAAAVEAHAQALARQTCARWPALQRALEGPDRCAAAMEAYYFQH